MQLRRRQFNALLCAFSIGARPVLTFAHRKILKAIMNHARGGEAETMVRPLDSA